MYLKRLELVGFKSFYNKTVLDFEPGITAVVGPNGCGKSNIFDSMRWVLGEQSVKALRGSEMQDVIFNGTDNKEPLGMAEVTLTFDNTKRFFPVDSDEVAVTRRIFRSGESEYLLNKAVVRLKDIMDLLLGTGIGAESYSLVQQGKIDLVLSSKPEERRMVFDEASGITKYKAQKREALRKLEETEQNLLRINDIVTEVKRQIGSLERQASKARRYKEVYEQLKSKEFRVGIWEKKELEAAKEAARKELARIGLEESGLLESIKARESIITRRKEQLSALEADMQRIKDQLMEFENTAARNAEKINFNRERKEELANSLKYLGEQVEKTRSRLNVDEEKLNKLKTEYDGIRSQIDAKAAALKQTESEFNLLTSGIKASLEKIAAAKKQILELAAAISGVRNEITDLNSKEQVLLSRRKRLELEKAKIAEEKAVAEDSLNAVNTEVANLEESFRILDQQLSSLKQDLEGENRSLEEIDHRMDELDKSRLTLQSHREFLQELRTKYEDISESMNAVIYLDKPPQEKMSGLVIKIREYLASDQGQVAVKLSGEAKPIDLDTERIAEKIAQIEAELESLKKTKEAKSQRITVMRSEVEQSEAILHDRQMELVNKKASQQSILEQFSKIKEEEEVAVLEINDVDEELKQLSGKAAELNSRLEILEARQKASDEQISAEQTEIGINTTLKEEKVVIITQIKTEMEALNRRISTDEATLKILQDTCEQDKHALLNLESQISEAKSRSAELEAESIELEKGIVKAKADLEAGQVSLKEAEAKIAEVAGDSDEILQSIETDRSRLDDLKGKQHELAMQEKENDYRILSLKERLMQSYKIDLDAPPVQPAVENVQPAAPAQEASAEPQTQQSQAENTVAPVPEIIPAAEAVVDMALIREEIERLKEKLDSYGTVNLVAIEEYDELKQRYDFLTQQHADLTTAKESLQEAIQKINRTTKKMFLETFELVKAEFRNYFRLLFNGGDAQVYLIDEQDPLESGIEIICRPPGKKLQNVLLLSGGEKSMSAIALIFAIFKIKPAPFCVLDEIDAALDEANVDRYGRVLQDFAKGSQFIIITHNKKTIASADVMYGITMEESGVSKIVSVKFGQTKKPAAPSTEAGAGELAGEAA